MKVKARTKISIHQKQQSIKDQEKKIQHLQLQLRIQYLQLQLCYCEVLRTIDNLKDLNSLKDVEIKQCMFLKSLPNVLTFSSWRQIRRIQKLLNTPFNRGSNCDFQYYRTISAIRKVQVHWTSIKGMQIWHEQFQNE